MTNKNYILYRFYELGYREAVEGKKPRIFKFNNATYFAHDIMWAYEKGYAAGLIDKKKLEQQRRK